MLVLLQQHRLCAYLAMNIILGMQECQVRHVQSNQSLSSNDNQTVPIHKAEGCIASVDAFKGLDLYLSTQTASGKCMAGTPAMPVS